MGKARLQAWRKAEEAFDRWEKADKAWQQAKRALPMITAEGQLNTRLGAQDLVQQACEQLPEKEFGKAKRLLTRDQTLTHLNVVQEKLDGIEAEKELVSAAVDFECACRSQAVMQRESKSGGGLRGVWLLAMAVLDQAGSLGQEVLASVREILDRSVRASSCVEGLNSVVRMHQSRHRNMSQELLDLKRLYWNLKVFRTGKRKNQRPYELLGLDWPEGWTWWDVVTKTPQELKDKLSTSQLPT
ncbi:MAG: hypothetical protein ACFCD0_11340 [Gemmataceae bacterium]